MKVIVRISGEGRTGVSRKSYDGEPTFDAVAAQVRDAMAQTLTEFAEESAPKAKKVAKKAKKKASKK